MISEKFPYSTKAVREGDGRTITLACHQTRQDADEWFAKFAEEWRKPKWGFREIWIEDTRELLGS